MSLLFVAVRESLVLVLGCLTAWLASVLLRGNLPPVPNMPQNPLLALFLPIIFCLVRASWIDKSKSEGTLVRQSCLPSADRFGTHRSTLLRDCGRTVRGLGAGSLGGMARRPWDRYWLRFFVLHRESHRPGYGP